MKHYQISNTPNITKENYANLFNVYMKDTDEHPATLSYSINKGIYFKNVENMAPSNFIYYICQERDQWSTISFLFYDTIELWWLVCKINNIVDPVKNTPTPGEEIKILNPDLVPGLLQQIRTA